MQIHPETTDNAKAKKIDLTRRYGENKFWVTVGHISAVIGVLGFVFAIGQYIGFRRARHEEFKTFLEYLSKIKEGVRIVNVTYDKTEVSHGEQCELLVNIENNSPYECTFWLGTTAIASGGKEFWSSTEDKTVTISPSGITGVKRTFTFPKDAIPGIYDIQVNLWYGQKSDPSQSERISAAVLRGQIVLKNR